MSKPRPTPLFINASHPFPLKARCKHCGSDKLVYYQDYTNPYWYPDPKYARSRGLRSTEGWIQYCPSDYLISFFRRQGIRLEPTHSVAFKRYSPKFSKSWAGVRPHRPHISNMAVVVVCKNCDQQTWVYMNSNVRRMPENTNRKARINCPDRILPFQFKLKRR